MDDKEKLFKKLEKRPKLKEIEDFKKETIKEFDEFFEMKINPNFKIFLLEKREEMDVLCERKTEDWLFGLTIITKGSIVIFHPEKVESETSHKKETFYFTLKHEIAHIYFFRNACKSTPKWLNEGLAYYLAKQKYNDKPLNEIVKSINFFFKFNSNYYFHAAKLVTLLIEKYGKEKILLLIKSWYMSEEDFAKNFKEIYGFNLSEEDLIKHLQ